MNVSREIFISHTLSLLRSLPFYCPRPTVMTFRFIRSFIHQWFYNPSLDPGWFFSFVIVYIVGRTLWNGGSARRKADTCTQTCMPWVRFEPTTPLFERSKTVHASDRAATVIGYDLQMERADSFKTGFVVDKVALGQVFSEYVGYPCQFSFHHLLHTQHLPSGAGTIGQLVADVPSGLSLAPPQETKKKDRRPSFAVLQVEVVSYSQDPA
jgi:hypothetical protein